MPFNLNISTQKAQKAQIELRGKRLLTCEALQLYICSRPSERQQGAQYYFAISQAFAAFLSLDLRGRCGRRSPEGRRRRRSRRRRCREAPKAPSRSRRWRRIPGPLRRPAAVACGR